MDKHEREMYERIMKWFKGKKQNPFKIDLELHRRCNLKCLSCSRRSSPDYPRLNEISRKLEMPTEKWLEIVDEAAELDVREWHIAGGGEPMFLPERTVPLMKRIKKYGMLGIITTNGTLWRDKDIETVVKIGWDRIHFSVDGPNAKIHDYLRGVPGTFKRVMRTIRKFNELKKKYKTDKPMLNMNMVLSKKNYKLLPEMVKLAKKLNIEFLFVDPLIVYSEIGAKLKMGEKEVKEFPKYLEKARVLARKYGINNNFDGLQNNLQPELIVKSSKMSEVVKDEVKRAEKIKVKPFIKKFLTVPCFKPWFHMTIKCDGRVTSCDVPITGGDNIKNKSLKEVWFGDYFEWLRKTLLSKRIPDFCDQCNASHATQRRKYRAEIIKMLSPKLFNEVKKLYGLI